MRCGWRTVACAGLLVIGNAAGGDPPKERYVLLLDGTPCGSLERVDPFAAHPVKEPRPAVLRMEPLKIELLRFR